MPSHPVSRALLLVVLLGLSVVVRPLAAAEAARRTFTLAAGDAAETLKAFSQQAGEQLVFLVDTVRGEKTAPLSGQYTPREALDRLLTGTQLVAAQDQETGALSVGRRSTSQAPSAPAPQRPPASRATQSTEDLHTLSPFEVRPDRDVGYLAADSLAGGRTEMALKDTPSAISVLTSEFLDDLALNDAWSADEWAVNSSSQAFAAGNANSPQGDYNFTNFRSLGGSYGSRNYFLWYVNSDNYSTDRLEFARGPNGVLFGDGNVGGITTVWTKRASLFYNRTTLIARGDTYGGIRGTVDVNRRLGKDAAIRVNLLDQSTPGWRDRSWRYARAAHLAATVRLGARDNVRVEGEASQDRRALYSNTYSDNASLWNGTTRYDGVRAPSTTGTGVANISTGIYNIVIPGLSRTTLYNFQNFYATTGSGILLQTAPRAEVPNIPALPNREFNIQPTDSEARVMFKTFSAYWEHRFTASLYTQLAFNNLINRRKTYHSETAVSNYLIDVNTVLPGGAPNPYVGIPYSEGMLNDRENSNHVDDLRGTLAWRADPSWIKQRLNLIWGTRMDRFSQLQRRLTRVNGPIANVSNAANVFRERFYWNQPGTPFGGIPEIPGYTFDYVPTSITSQRKSINYQQLASTSQFFDNRLTFLLGIRRDVVNDRQRTTTGLPVDPVTGLPQLGAVIPVEGSAATRAVVGGQTDTRFTPVSKNGGVVFFLLPSVGIAANYSESFAPPTSGANQIDGTPAGVSLSQGYDVGVRLSLNENRLFFSANYYHSQQTGRLDFSNTNTTEINRIWTNMGRLDLASLSYRDARDVEGSGLEFELTANPGKQWRLTANLALPRTEALNLLPGLRAYVAQNLPAWQAAGANPAIAQRAQILADITTIQGTLNTNTNGTVLSGTFRYLANYYGTYTFANRLKGLSAGAGFNLRGPAKISNTTASLYEYIYSRSYLLVSAHANYRFDLFRRRSSVQLNVSNLLNNRRVNYTGTADFRAGNIATNPLLRIPSGFTYFDPLKVTLTLRTDF